jgi:polyisoprenoid-binding protein YceI
MSKTRILIGGGMAAVLLVIVAAVVVWRLRSDDPDLLTEAPAIPTGTAETAAGVGDYYAEPVATPAAAAAAEPTTVVDLPEGVLHFVVDSSGSSAKYVVEETLAGLPATAVGETSEVSGNLFLTVDGIEPSLPSGFQVDLRTLTSDESRRDNYIRGTTLQTSQYPFATFEITGMTGFPADYVEDTEVELTLTGDLTVKDVTLPITWQVKARKVGDTMTAVADTEFKMSEFGISPPQVAIAQAKDGVQLQVVLVLKQQGQG